MSRYVNVLHELSPSLRRRPLSHPVRHAAAKSLVFLGAENRDPYLGETRSEDWIVVDVLKESKTLPSSSSTLLDHHQDHECLHSATKWRAHLAVFSSKCTTPLTVVTQYCDGIIHGLFLRKSMAPAMKCSTWSLHDHGNTWAESKLVVRMPKESLAEQDLQMACNWPTKQYTTLAMAKARIDGGLFCPVWC